MQHSTYRRTPADLIRYVKGRRPKAFDNVYVVALICMDPEKGRKMAEIIRKANPEHSLVKDLFYDENLMGRDCTRIISEAIKEKEDVQLLILNNINPDFRRYRDNEEFTGWLSDVAHECYIVDLMYLEDKYKDEPEKLLRKMECEADYSRACIDIYLTNGEDDDAVFMHKYMKEWREQQDAIPSSDSEEDDEDMEDSGSEEEMQDEEELGFNLWTPAIMTLFDQPTAKEDGSTEEVCTYQIVYLKNMCFPPFKPDPNKNYFVNFTKKH